MKEMEELKGKNNEKEISLNEIFEYLKKALLNLRSKWFLIFLAGLLGSSIGFIYAFYKKPIYTANLSFVVLSSLLSKESFCQSRTITFFYAQSRFFFFLRNLNLLNK